MFFYRSMHILVEHVFLLQEQDEVTVFLLMFSLSLFFKETKFLLFIYFHFT